MNLEEQVLALKSIDLPYQVSAGRVKEIESLKQWGYNFKVNTFGDYCQDKFSIEDIPQEFLSTQDTLATETRCIIYDPNSKRILVDFKKKIVDIQDTSIHHAVIDSLEIFGQQRCSQPKEETELLGKRDPVQDGYYVCHNLWVFLSHPPCVMCSMALTHSRISRLYYFESEADLVCGKIGLVGGCQTQKLNPSVDDKTPQIFCD